MRIQISSTLKRVQRRNAGFTLLEVMIVVMVVSIMVTIAIPGISNARRRANEASAITAMRSMSSAQSIYRTRFGRFADLADLESSGLLDENFADGEKSGYAYANVSSPTGGSWSISASPINPGISGDRYFFIDTSGVIRFRDDGVPNSTDQAIE